MAGSAAFVGPAGAPAGGAPVAAPGMVPGAIAPGPYANIDGADCKGADVIIDEACGIANG